MKELTLREIQLAEFEILKKIDSICKKINVKYFLWAGTLLGAIRHGKIIPWDDDIDIAMPRPDYEKLISYLIENNKELRPFELKHYKTDKNYIYPVARICDSKYKVVFEESSENNMGLFIDIYPIDGCGNNSDECIVSINRADKYRLFANAARKSKYIKSDSSIIKSIIKFVFFLYGKAFSNRKLIILCDRNAKKIDYNRSKYVAVLAWHGNHQGEELEKDFLIGERNINFEGCYFPIPMQSEKILSIVYGEYNKLPSFEQQKPQHKFVVYKQ